MIYLVHFTEFNFECYSSFVEIDFEMCIQNVIVETNRKLEKVFFFLSEFHFICCCGNNFAFLLISSFYFIYWFIGYFPKEMKRLTQKVKEFSFTFMWFVFESNWFANCIPFYLCVCSWTEEKTMKMKWMETEEGQNANDHTFSGFQFIWMLSCWCCWFCLVYPLNYDF